MANCTKHIVCLCREITAQKWKNSLFLICINCGVDYSNESTILVNKLVVVSLVRMSPLVGQCIGCCLDYSSPLLDN